MTLVLRDARLPGSDSPFDVSLNDGRVAAIAPAGVLTGDVVRLDGRWLRPGLWDEHVHFTQWVLRQRRIDLSRAASAAEAVALVATALSSTSGPLVGHGFRDGLWPDRPTLAALDAIAPDRPVTLVSGDLHCGWMNSPAFAALGAPPEESGLLREAAWINALDRTDKRALPSPDAYQEAAQAAARRGVVGIVDFENADNVHLWPARGVTSLRVEASIWPDRLAAAVEAGYRTGQVLDAEGLITVGRLKVVVDGSLNTRTAYCWDPYPDLPPDAPSRCGVQSVSPSELGGLLELAHSAGIAPAVHAIGDRANSFVIDEFERLGIAGTIEHAQLVSVGDFPRFGRLGLTASIQPEHAMDDRDVADHHWAGRTDRAFAFRSLLDAGATLRLGSDAPVAPLDPWLALSAAISRSRDGRRPWHPEQRIERSVALAASARGRLAPAEGDVADLIVLETDPLTASAPQLREMAVAGTLVGGRWTWSAL